MLIAKQTQRRLKKYIYLLHQQLQAYKKAALKWHPDKNQDRDTTEIFQQIQEAHECLTNADERAWYDSHRDQILKGKDVGDS